MASMIAALAYDRYQRVKSVFSPSVTSPEPDDWSSDQTYVNDSELAWQEVGQGIKVQYDEQRLPVAWKDAMGNSGTFNTEAIKQLFQTAKDTGRRQLADIVRVETRPTSQSGEALMSELPADTLSKEQLRTRGIEIIATDKVDLHIRAGAFAPGELLHAAQDGQAPLKIVLVDGPLLSQKAMRDDRYDSIRTIIDQEPLFVTPTAEQRKADLISLYSKLADDIGVDAYEEHTHYLRAVALLEKGIIPERDIENWSLYGGTNGYHLPKDFRGAGNPPTDIIFLAIGERPTIHTLDVFVEPDGTQPYVLFSAVDTNEVFNLNHAHGLNPNDGYPTTDQFQVLTQPAGWAWDFSPLVEPATKTPGFILAHELAHFTKYNSPDAEQKKRYDHEADTDQMALDYTQRAQERKSLRGDDSGYYLVFENRETSQLIPA